MIDTKYGGRFLSDHLSEGHFSCYWKCPLTAFDGKRLCMDRI